MPGLLPVQCVNTYQNASDIPPEVIALLKARPQPANTIMPHILGALEAERKGEKPSGHQVWITCTSSSPRPVVEFVLSVTEGSIGPYPIFIFTLQPHQLLTDGYLLPRLRNMVEALQAAVPIYRVYSVFAREIVSYSFAKIWKNLTGVNFYVEPYYASKMSYCTLTSFINRSTTRHPDLIYDLRPGVEDDIEEIGGLCFGFARESEPFVLTHQQAIEEAAILVSKEQVWVHRIQSISGQSGIASIVAFTRNDDMNATITKVYTSPSWRKLGCAERLVRRVTKELLLTKETVTLYVSHGNPAAKVYDKIGFLGLRSGVGHVENIEDYTEYGFDRSKVQLGHW